MPKSTSQTSPGYAAGIVFGFHLVEHTEPRFRVRQAYGEILPFSIDQLNSSKDFRPLFHG
ncbi:MAG: hypothetical protein WDN28_16955 [Chthoniobacter sp.]